MTMPLRLMILNILWEKNDARKATKNETKTYVRYAGGGCDERGI